MATAPGTGLAIFNPGAAVPAHIAQYAEQHEANLEARGSTPDSLSPEGKTWTIILGGQKHRLQQRNSDGDVVPMSVMKFIVLDYNKARGRAYYEGEYDPANASAPICWSDDGVAPHSSLPGPFPAGTQIEQGKSRKISAACSNCPMAVKGSKVAQGKQLTACAQHRMLVIIPAPELGLPEALVKPLRLKIAMTSDWDKQSPDQEQQGWLAWTNFVDWLLARNVKHSALLVVKAKFDPEAPYPKIFFSAERYLTEAELATITPLTKSEAVTKLLAGTWTPAGGDGVPVDQQDVAQPAIEAAAAVTPAAIAATAETVAAAPAPAVQPQYVMVDGEEFTMQQYLDGGWTIEQLLQHGKARIAGEPAPVAAAAPTIPSAPPPAATAPSPAVVVSEPVAQPVAASAPVVTETVTVVATPAQPVAEPSSPAVVAEVAPPVQEPAQAAAPVPAPAPVIADPPAAAAAAEAASPAVSTDVPEDVEALLAQWGPEAAPAA